MVRVMRLPGLALILLVLYVGGSDPSASRAKEDGLAGPRVAVAKIDRYHLESALQKRVNEAIRKGLRFLRRARHVDGTWGRSALTFRLTAEPDDSPPIASWMPGAISGEIETTAFCGLVLALRGHPAQARATLKILREHEEDVAYDSRAAALTLLIAQAVEPASLPKLDPLRDALIAGQLRSGLWSYSLRTKARGSPEMPSSYWSAQGLATGESKTMTRAEARCWERLRDAMTRNGGKGGGWGYMGRSRAHRSYFQGSFMSSGLLHLAMQRLDVQPRSKRASLHDRKRFQAARARITARVLTDVDTFLKWLEDPALEKPPGSITWPYHTLFVMARACHDLDLDSLDGLKWYERTAKVLVSSQEAEGSWPARVGGTASAQCSSLSRTALALLCLRSAQPSTTGVSPKAGPVTPDARPAK